MRPSVLILTARYGSGHLQVANVIAEELKTNGFKPVVSDLFGESHPAFSNITQSLFIKTFSYGSSFYKWFYYGTNKLPSKRLAHFSQYLGRKRLLELIIDNRPVYVLSTFPLHVAPFTIKKAKYLIPTYTVITDYCVHPYWINPFIDHYFVSSQSVKTSLIQQNIHKQKITISGIPIRPEFERLFDKKAIYQKYHLSPQKKVITILAGAHGVLKNVKELCQLLLQNSYQIVLVCGKNVSLYERLLPLCILYPDSFFLYGYVEKIHELFAVSDCMITKPGGITITEAAALQVPLIFHKPVPGQEAENAQYFTEKGASFVSNSIEETVHHVHKVLQNEALTTMMKKNLHQIYKPCSAKTIIDHATNQLEQQSQLLH
ncbi:MGDG synthase family glycosyltransferase [Bacillus sp. 03113]|uniref:MGDG synthase family glycosyltransferase n=1 Tax=Bacillus sp. 03113 TaxID=2578211 RepID=UPI0011442761|nr:glycosyltransferase [Bacillus sp. 03113]